MNYFRCGGGRSTHTATKIDVAKTPLATFSSNVSGLYIPEVLAYIQATQSGTGDPSPSNPRTINGVDSLYVTRTGKNLFASLFTLNAYITGSGTVTSGPNDRTVACAVKPSTKYTISFTRSVITGTDDWQVGEYTDMPDIGSTGNRLVGSSMSSGVTSATITTGATTNYLAIKIANVTKTNLDATLATLQLEFGETATSYEQFKGDPHIPFFDGLIKGTYGYVDLGSLSWTYSNTFFLCNISSLGFAGNDHYLCEGYNNVGLKYDTAMANQPTGSIGYSGYTIKIKDTDYTDATAFANALRGKYLIFELASATTPTITTAELNMLMSAFGIEGVSAYIMLGGTYYGGYLNVTTGLLTLDRGMVKLSDINWTGATSNPPVFRGVLSSIPNIQVPPNNAVPTTAITESFGAYAYSPLSSSSIGKFAISDGDSNRIVFIDNSVNTLEAFLQAHGDDILVYPLATPQTYQLTPAQIEQLLGQNNVFCSSGDVAVKYWKID